MSTVAKPMRAGIGTKVAFMYRLVLRAGTRCYIRHYNHERCHTAIGVPPHFYAQSLKCAA